MRSRSGSVGLGIVLSSRSRYFVGSMDLVKNGGLREIAHLAFPDCFMTIFSNEVDPF